MNIDELLNYQVPSRAFLLLKFIILFLILKPEKPAVSSANASANKRPTDSAMAISAGYPKRVKRPILDDVHVSSNGSLINNTNLASLSIDEREKLLQMLEQESSV